MHKIVRPVKKRKTAQYLPIGAEADWAVVILLLCIFIYIYSNTILTQQRIIHECIENSDGEWR